MVDLCHIAYGDRGDIRSNDTKHTFHELMMIHFAPGSEDFQLIHCASANPLVRISDHLDKALIRILYQLLDKSYTGILNR